MVFTLVIPQPTGVCSGVRNVFDYIQEVRRHYPHDEIFANHQPAHHEEADRLLESNNISVLDPGKCSQIKPGALVIGSAHGTPLEEIEQVRQQGARFLDATCPLVGGNFNWISDSRNNILVYVGKRGHREFEATLSRSRTELCFSVDLHDSARSITQAIRKAEVILPIILLRQTTIPANDPDFIRIQGELTQFLPGYEIARSQGECFATQNRQESLVRAIKQYLPGTILVLTAKHSSNGMALVHTAQQAITKVMWTESAHELADLAIRQGIFTESDPVLLVAAASVIDSVVDETSYLLEEAAKERSCGYRVERPWLIDREREPILRTPSIN